MQVKTRISIPGTGPTDKNVFSPPEQPSVSSVKHKQSERVSPSLSPEFRRMSCGGVPLEVSISPEAADLRSLIAFLYQQTQDPADALRLARRLADFADLPTTVRAAILENAERVQQQMNTVHDWQEPMDRHGNWAEVVATLLMAASMAWIFFPSNFPNYETEINAGLSLCWVLFLMGFTIPDQIQAHHRLAAEMQTFRTSLLKALRRNPKVSQLWDQANRLPQ